MNKFFSYILCFFISLLSFSQDQKKIGHTNQNKFKQLYDEFATPNAYRSASGAPGPSYYQQKADYKMKILLDDDKQMLYGEQEVVYTNNSPSTLEYLWLQLDQNIRKKDSPSLLKNSQSVEEINTISRFANSHLKEPFDGGFNITSVTNSNGDNLSFTINQTMLRINLQTPLSPGDVYSFNVKWWYNINNHVIDRARSGYEYFEEDNNRAYVIAQFFPRMCVYNDVEGWQNHQFWGNGEFALPFGDYEVDITVPANFILDATGELINRKEVFSKKMMERYELAKN